MTKFNRPWVSLLMAPILFASCGGNEPPRMNEKAFDYFAYFGTYTREDSKGIYVSRFNSETGELTPPELAAELANPNFLAVHPNQLFLYAVSRSEAPDGQPIGEAAAFAIDSETGKLALLNKVSSGGDGPCHINVDRTGQAVAVANYSSGTVAALPVKDGGRLAEPSAIVEHSGSSVNPERQQGPHAHSVNFTPDNRFVVAADLGLDKLFLYRFDPDQGSLTPGDLAFAKVEPGAGPRHFTFHPNGQFGYAINELQSTVTVFEYDGERGVLRELQTISTLPKDFEGDNHTAEVLVHPSGRFLYGSNRGHHSIAVFAIDAGKGTLTPVEHVSTQGNWPRNFVISPGGKYLIAANERSNNVVVFRIDGESGRLTATGETLRIDSPVCVRFVPAG